MVDLWIEGVSDADFVFVVEPLNQLVLAPPLTDGHTH